MVSAIKDQLSTLDNQEGEVKISNEKLVNEVRDNVNKLIDAITAGRGEWVLPEELREIRNNINDALDKLKDN